MERSPLGAPSAAQSRPLYGYGSGAQQSSRIEPRSTGSIGAPRSAPVASSDSNWSSSGGTMITLGRGETVHTIAQRYGVPASAIMKANGLTSASDAGEGRQILIPTYSASAGGYKAAAAAPAVAPVETRPFGSRPIAAVETPMAKPVAPKATVAAVQPVAPAASAKGKMQFIQGAQPKGAVVASVDVKPIPAKPVEVKPVEPKAKVAAVTPAKPAPSEQAFAAAPAKVQTPAASADDGVKTAALKAEDAPSGPQFRWPARGRVISGYGSKTSGASNDGVNIAVPEGTEVKASDDGVVAYSGSELKGFGNLVLIRHSNGWVTAYAHNSALNVKRGDTVRRGQIIAKSGSTGNVTSPQLHFEVRKGAQTVDPIKHLPDA